LFFALSDFAPTVHAMVINKKNFALSNKVAVGLRIIG